MIKDDNIVNQLIERKREIMRAFDRGNFTEEEYVKQLSEIEAKIRQRNNEAIEKAIIKRQEQEEQEQEEEKQAVIKEVKGRTPKTGSYASNIEKALCMEEIKSFDDVFNKLEELKPGKTKKVITVMTKNIIREVQRQKQPRWRGYKWVEEKFLLIPPND